MYAQEDAMMQMGYVAVCKERRNLEPLAYWSHQLLTERRSQYMVGMLGPYLSRVGTKACWDDMSTNFGPQQGQEKGTSEARWSPLASWRTGS